MTVFLAILAILAIFPLKTHTGSLYSRFQTEKTQNIAHTINIFPLATLRAPLGTLWGPKNIFSFKNTYQQPILLIPDRKNPKHCSYNRYFHLGDPWGPPGGPLGVHKYFFL